MAQPHLIQPQKKIAVLLSWCTANEIVIHPDLEIVLNEPQVSTEASVPRRSTATARPLVDYSDDESNDDSYDEDEEMYPNEDMTEGERARYEHSNDDSILGITVIARNFVESGSTVVQIPPYSVLSYPNVFGAPAETALVSSAAADEVTRPTQRRGRIVHSTAEGPTTAKGTSSKLPRSPPDTVKERSGMAGYATTVSHRKSTHGPDDSITYSAPHNDNNIDEHNSAGNHCGAAEKAGLTLSLALLNELVKGDASRWWGYLQSLPAEPSLAVFWDDAEFASDDTRRELCGRARKLIAGTQLDRYLQSPAIQGQKNAIEAFFKSIVCPFLQANLPSLSNPARWALFRRAYTFVSSRAFWVDAYHGLAMVPIADAFNHSDEHHVHLETDWEVCRVCGALETCPHDEEDDEMIASQGNSIVHSFDMVSNRPICQGEQVFNTYNVESRSQRASGNWGGIGNVHLFCRYGFILEGNGADRIAFEEGEMEQIVELGPVAHSAAKEVGAVIDNARALFAGLIMEEEEDEPGFQMDAEGCISSVLWTRLARAAITTPSSSSIRRGIYNGGGEGTKRVESPVNHTERTIVQGVCSGVVRLCEGRLRQVVDGDDDVVEERFDARLVTLVGRYVRGERALLKAAVQVWREFGSSV